MGVASQHGSQAPEATDPACRIEEMDSGARTERPGKSRELIEKPAAKILDFYSAFENKRMAAGLKHSMANGVAASRTIAELEPVNKD